MDKIMSTRMDEAVIQRIGMLAKTAMHVDGKIYTLNTQHYPMPEVVAQRAWRA